MPIPDFIPDVVLQTLTRASLTAPGDAVHHSHSTYYILQSYQWFTSVW